MSEFIVNLETHRGYLDGVVIPSVGAVLREAGMSPDFTEINRDVLKYATERGSAVHAATQFLDEGTLDRESVDPAIAGYLAAYEKFKEEKGFVPALIEQPVHDPVRRYWGILDRTGMLLFDNAVIDLKCTSEISPYVCLTLAAYTAATTEPGAKRMAVQLFRDGKYISHPFKDRRDIRIFYNSLENWWWKAANVKGFYDGYCNRGC